MLQDTPPVQGQPADSARSRGQKGQSPARHRPLSWAATTPATISHLEPSVAMILADPLTMMTLHSPGPPRGCAWHSLKASPPCSQLPHPNPLIKSFIQLAYAFPLNEFTLETNSIMHGSNCRALKVTREKRYNENMYQVLPFSLDTVAKPAA